MRTLHELARSYLTLTQDVTRVMNRIKGVYRSQAIACAGKRVYTMSHRSEWLEQLEQPGQRRRAERLYAQLDLLQPLRQQARQELLTESRKYPVRHISATDPSRRSHSRGTADRIHPDPPTASVPSDCCGPTVDWA